VTNGLWVLLAIPYTAIKIMKDIGSCDGRMLAVTLAWINAWMYCNCCYNCFMFLWPCIVSEAWRKNTNKMQQYIWFIVNSRCWLLTTVSTCFGHLYAHHQEKRSRVTAYGVYLLVVLDVAGCGSAVLRCRVWALWRLLLEQQPSQCSHPTT